MYWEEIQAGLKKVEMEMILTIQWKVSLKNVDLGSKEKLALGKKHDDTDLGWEGNQSKRSKQQPFEYAYLCGAVCQATENTMALITLVMNMMLWKTSSVNI